MLHTLPVGSVRVGGEIGRRIDNTIRNNMLAVDIDADFIEPFRRRDAQFAYVGIGHFLDALSRFEAYRPDGDVSALKERILSALAATREADGYIGLFPPERRMSRLWDVHEASHLIYGLSSDHRLSGNGLSLDLAQGLAGSLIRRWRADPDAVANQFVMATLDLEPALLSLYQETGNDDLLDFCMNDRDLAGWNRPIVEGRWGRIEGHIYDYLSRCLAQLTLMQSRPSAGLTRTTNRALDYMLAGNGMMITGELGDHECWHSSQEGTIHLGETCATAYLIRLLHVLLQQTGETLYGDLMERAIYNALFAAQSPDGRRIRYYTPIDGPRSYFGPDTYCCPNNFRRIVSELPEMICYTTPRGLFINLFAESELRTAGPDGTEIGLSIRTAYPADGTIDIEIKPDGRRELELAFRVPRWCQGAKLMVNGALQENAVAAGSVARVERWWKPGDQVRLELPMETRLVAGRKAQAGRAAVMRGPQVFSLSRTGVRAPDSAVTTDPATIPDREAIPGGTDLRLIVMDPGSLSEPEADDTVRPAGRRIAAKAWSADEWYPVQKPNLTLTLQELPDPDGELVYLKAPIPNDRRFVEDELLGPRGAGAAGRNGAAAAGFYESPDTDAESDPDSAETLRRLQS